MPSLAFAIFRAHFLSNSKISKLNGNFYTDIKKSYTGGHVDVYQLYSNKECRLYDFVSLYPSVMAENRFPSKLKDKFSGHPFNIGYNIDYLHNNDILSFIFCDIFVDNSINRPVYQTHVFFKGKMRTMCATGLFKNQWINVPELVKYQLLTNHKIRIVENSIKEGYLFESCKLFSSYVEPLFNLN